MHSRKADYRQVVQLARESAQTAEDARIIAQKREQETAGPGTQIENAKGRLPVWFPSEHRIDQRLRLGTRVEASVRAGVPPAPSPLT